MTEGQQRFFADVDIDAESINFCACGEPIPEEYGYCWECRDWSTARKRAAAYRRSLMLMAE